MDFLTLNFGQLLHLLEDELKNIIRNFEKQKKQIISAQYGILFNQTWNNPAYFNIYIYIHAIDLYAQTNANSPLHASFCIHMGSCPNQYHMQWLLNLMHVHSLSILYYIPAVRLSFFHAGFVYH